MLTFVNVAGPDLDFVGAEFRNHFLSVRIGSYWYALLIQAVKLGLACALGC